MIQIALFIFVYLVVGAIVAMIADMINGELEEGSYAAIIGFWPIVVAAIVVVGPLIVVSFLAKKLVSIIRRRAGGPK